MYKNLYDILSFTWNIFANTTEREQLYININATHIYPYIGSSSEFKYFINLFIHNGPINEYTAKKLDNINTTVISVFANVNITSNIVIY